MGWELVLADGTIKNVDAKKEPELAVALRGSGSALGTAVPLTKDMFILNANLQAS